MATIPLPIQVLEFVQKRHSSSPKKMVSALRLLLRKALHDPQRAMSSSPIRSIRRNAKTFRGLYTQASLASRLLQAARDGQRGIRERLIKISQVLHKSLEHYLGLLGACQHKLGKQLADMCSIGMPPERIGLSELRPAMIAGRG